jgi:putative glutamine amidotransferase
MPKNLSQSSIHIAIPEPISPDDDREAPAYNQRALPQYLAALHSVGAIPVLVTLNESPARVAKILATAQGVLLPGSRADVDPARYGEARHPLCAPSDPERAAVDELLIQDAFQMRKPILAICQGIQTLNVWLGGTLIQDLPEELGEHVNHSPGREITSAHTLSVMPNSLLEAMANAAVKHGEARPIMVNSSHHQALQRIGDRLRVTAASPLDAVVEAVELLPELAEKQWLLGVQWHPERTVATSALSREIFQNFAAAAEQWKQQQ